MLKSHVCFSMAQPIPAGMYGRVLSLDWNYSRQSRTRRVLVTMLHFSHTWRDLAFSKPALRAKRFEQIKMSTETKFYKIQNAPLYWFLFYFYFTSFFFFFFSAAELTRLRFAVINRNLNNPVEAVGLWRYSLIGYPSNPPLRHVMNDQCWNLISAAGQGLINLYPAKESVQLMRFLSKGVSQRGCPNQKCSFSRIWILQNRE